MASIPSPPDKVYLGSFFTAVEGYMFSNGYTVNLRYSGTGRPRRDLYSGSPRTFVYSIFHGVVRSTSLPPPRSAISQSKPTHFRAPIPVSIYAMLAENDVFSIADCSEAGLFLNIWAHAISSLSASAVPLKPITTITTSLLRNTDPLSAILACTQSPTVNPKPTPRTSGCASCGRFAESTGLHAPT